MAGAGFRKGEAEDAAQFPQHILPGGDAFAGAAGAVDVPRQIKEGRHGLGGIEVIVHSGGEPGGIRGGVNGPFRIAVAIAIAVADCAVGGCGVVVAGGQGVADALQAAFCGGGAFRAVSQRAAVVAAQKIEPDGVRAVLPQGVGHGHQVAQGFAHLVRAQLQQAVVHPVAGEGAGAGVAFALGDFVLVMGEYQILAAPVNVQLRAQVFQRHCGAFNVPARTPRPPGAFPGRFAGFGAFPEDEIHRVFLVFVHLDAGAGDHTIQGAVAEFAVVVLAGDAEIDIAGGRVGVAAFNEAGDGVDDAGNLPGGAGIDGGALDVEGVHSAEIVADEFLRQRVGGYARFLGAADYLVVNVGEILDVPDFVPAVFQVAAQGVKNHIAEGVAHMGGRVRGDAAHVHLDQIAVGGDEFLDPAAQGAVEFHRNFAAGRGSGARQQGHGSGGDALGAPGEAQIVGGGSLDADPVGVDGQGGGQVGAHRRDVRRQAGPLRQHCSIYVDNKPTGGGDDPGRAFQQQQAADAGQRRVAGGEMRADVAGAGGAQQGVNDRVAQNIAVAVAGQPPGVGDSRAAEDERAVAGEGVGVGSGSDAVRGQGRGHGRG